MRITEFNQRDFLRAAPTLQLLLAVDCLGNFIERFKIEQPLNVVFFGEAFESMKFVLEDPLAEIVGHADVKRAGQAAHDVNGIELSLARHRALPMKS